MSLAFWFEEDGIKMGSTYISDGIMNICEALEKRGILPPGGGKLEFMDDNKGSQIAPILEKAIASLSNEGYNQEDPFAGSEGNARACLSSLRQEALRRPDAKVVAWR